MKIVFRPKTVTSMESERDTDFTQEYQNVWGAHKWQQHFGTKYDIRLLSSKPHSHSAKLEFALDCSLSARVRIQVASRPNGPEICDLFILCLSMWWQLKTGFIQIIALFNILGYYKILVTIALCGPVKWNGLSSKKKTTTAATTLTQSIYEIQKFLVCRHRRTGISSNSHPFCRCSTCFTHASQNQKKKINK